MKTEYTFTASDGENIAVTAFGSKPNHDTRCVIYVHGFKGFKDWGFVPYIGEYLSEKGFCTLTFNFSHNGIGDNPTEFSEMEKFARNTLSREVRELSEITDAVRGGFFGPVKNPNVGLLGHSRGGGITLLSAARKRDVTAAAVWSSVSTFDRYSEEIQKKWREDGYIEVVNARTGQVMHLNVSLLDDFEIYRNDLLNVEKAVTNLHCPLLVVHGEEDESVPVAESKQIHKWSRASDEQVLLVPGTGHTFGAKHPFEGSNEKLDIALEKTAAFFEKFL